MILIMLNRLIVCFTCLLLFKGGHLCAQQCSDNEIVVTLQHSFEWADDLIYFIKDDSDEVIEVGEHYWDPGSQGTYEDTFCLPDGCLSIEWAGPPFGWISDLNTLLSLPSGSP